jgi:hypothetical protein
MEYQVVTANEWLYPDSKVSPGGSREISLAAARGARAACQVLFQGVSRDAPISCEFKPDAKSSKTPWQTPEIYQLVDVAVTKNTGPRGFVVKQGESAADYTTRPAPFRVYDAMKPLASDSLTRADTEALLICWLLPVDAAPGRYTGQLIFKLGNDTCTIPVVLEVFPATVPADGTLAITNWFSLENMAKSHGLKMWRDAHWAMVRRYGEMMRRGRQNHFWVPLTLVDIQKQDAGRYSFDFALTARLIRLFFDLGFTCLEGGHLGTRIHFRDPDFVLRADRNIKATSPEGYAFLAQFLPAWHTFLQRNDWWDRTIQYVADEPIEKSAADYRVLAGIVRKFLPGVPLIDAVETANLGGAVDIWVPKNSYYQEHQEEFEAHRRLGDALWCYTCCFPGGRYMNRLLDMPLIRTRFLHWGNFLYNLVGYLHWGLNHYKAGQDPFEETSPAHGTGGTTNLPPGDTHIVYPGPQGPWGSVRLEAMAAGIEDYELLRLLEAKDKKLAERIVSSCLRSFNDADEDPTRFNATHRRLLQAASK